MDLFDILEHLDYEEDVHNYARTRRPRNIRSRPDFLTILDDVDFRSRFRLSKQAVRHVHSLIYQKLSTKTKRNSAISPMEQITLTLRFLATGSYLMTAGDFSGISKSAACRTVKKVCEAIAQLRTQYIRFPDDLASVKKNFYELARFPRVIGAIDCTHVLIKSPGGENAETFRNRKSQFSINVQMVCDRHLRVLDIVARWPGSSHDQTIFNNSAIKQRLERGDFRNCFILGDSGYENTSYLLTPLSNPQSPAENLYNESQIRTRNVIERAFGVIKNRFPVLRRTVTVSLNRVQAIIVACAVLHNIAVDMKEEMFAMEEPEDYVAIESERRDIDNNVRRTLIDEYFAMLVR